MTITATIKKELASTPVCKMSARRAEIATIVRFAGQTHRVADRVIVQVELDQRTLARRTYRDLTGIYGHDVEIRELSGRHLLRVVASGGDLARQTGLLDIHGRSIHGLPAQLVVGSLTDAAAIWRAAVLTRGFLSDSGREARLEVSCPTTEVAIALVGLARRLGFEAKLRRLHHGDLVTVQGTDAIVALLAKLGATKSARQWEYAFQLRRQISRSMPLLNLNQANETRMARAAAHTAQKVEHAMTLLGESAPDHLVDAGRLRIAHSTVSLEQLGRLADPPITKDSIAGRIRRLLALADKWAQENGLPDTTSVIAQ